MVRRDGASDAGGFDAEGALLSWAHAARRIDSIIRLITTRPRLPGTPLSLPCLPARCHDATMLPCLTTPCR